MTRSYLDTNYLFAHLRTSQEPAVAGWRRRVAGELAGDAAVISGLVVDELAYRLVLAWLRDDGAGDPLSTFRRSPGEVMRRMRTRLERVWAAIDRLQLELVAIDAVMVTTAKRLMVKPGLAPRDAFHAATALGSGCEAIVSSDEGFGTVRGLQLIGPSG